MRVRRSLVRIAAQGAHHRERPQRGGHTLNATAHVLKLVLAVLLATTGTAEAQTASGELLKVVVVSRHGVRTPLEPVKELDRWTRRPGGWPPCPTPGVRPRGRIGSGRPDSGRDRTGDAHGRLLPGPPRRGSRVSAGRCPERKTVFIRADVDDRTRATGEAIAKDWRGLPEPMLTFPSPSSRRSRRSRRSAVPSHLVGPRLPARGEPASKASSRACRRGTSRRSTRSMAPPSAPCRTCCSAASATSARPRPATSCGHAGSLTCRRA